MRGGSLREYVSCMHTLLDSDDSDDNNDSNERSLCT